MKRIFFWFFVFLGVFLLFFISLNLFDSRPETGPAAPKPFEGGRPPAAHLGAGNGFFLIWGFAEPPGADPAAEAFRSRILELFSDPPQNYLFRSRYGQWLTRLNAGYRQNWQGANLYFPQLPGEDVCAYFSSRRVQIAERRQRFAEPLRRYRQVLLAADLEDFTPVGWDPPARSLLLATYAARLFAASRALAALDGHWLQACDDLHGAMAAGLKLIASGRTLAVNSLGKTMVELSLRTLGSLLNRSDCPDAAARRILERLPSRPMGEFGTTAARTFTWMGFAQALERVKKEKIVDPFLLKDYFSDPSAFYAVVGFVGISRMHLFTTAHALAAFFVKEKESVSMLWNFWERVGRLEETPPYLRESIRRDAAWLGEGLDLSSFWWLRNPLGKMMVISAVPHTWPVLQHYVYRSQGLKVRYDLTRLLAQARLAAGGEMKLDEAVLRLLLDVGERDPFSGKPYLFHPGSGMLYGVGPDRLDDGGRERPAWWRGSDIAVSIKFVNLD